MESTPSTLNYDTEISSVEDRKNPIHRLYAQAGFTRAKLLARIRRFQFRDQSLRYQVASYNATWLNERCIELAIIDWLLPDHGDILEIGNVWGHYLEHGHTVVDKYEVAPGVRNCDVVEIPLDEQYDFIFSISTFEHVGWDELPQVPEKFSLALRRTRELLKRGGTAVITVPIGWNDWLDQQLKAGTLDVDGIDWLVRRGYSCNWRSSSAAEALATSYGSPRPHANGLAILTLKSR